MRIGIAADHGGFELKQKLAERLRGAGHQIQDFGAHQLAPGDDYPDFIIPLGQAVAAGKVYRGVAVCGSGVGACVCANKIKGIRACLIEDHFSARQGVEDDNLNLICLGGRIEAGVGMGINSDIPDSQIQPGTPARAPIKKGRGVGGLTKVTQKRRTHYAGR